MQLPYRKPGKYSHLKKDPHMTAGKFGELKEKLEKLKTVSRPPAALEVKRLGEMGDFSENAAYQMAKGRLRGINQRIDELEDQISHASIITPVKNTKTVQLGSTVTIEIDGKQKTYLILGSSESDPEKGIISDSSPLGMALIGRKSGDSVSFKQADRLVAVKVAKIR